MFHINFFLTLFYIFFFNLKEIPKIYPETCFFFYFLIFVYINLDFVDIRFGGNVDVWEEVKQLQSLKIFFNSIL